ncbi:MAG: alpha/beta hydrolase [Verrucomicrobia bacterium]|nr:alpha/beta hydrolase [Verrucomicrobiota bacterium]
MLFFAVTCAAGERAGAVAATAASPAAIPQVRVVRDVAYLDHDRTEKLDLYFPPDLLIATTSGTGEAPASTPVPPPRAAVVYLHGGGWVSGDKGQARDINMSVQLAQAGYVCANANYRLGPNSWPTNLLDCKNAVRFLRANAAKHRIDPKRIAVVGTSAGAHLALLLGFTADQPDFEPVAPYPGISSRVSAIVELYGVTNPLTRRAVDKATGEATAEWADANTPVVLGAMRQEDPARWARFAPVNHAAAHSPPVLIIHGLADPVVSYLQAVELAKILGEKGVEHELVLLPGVVHQFDLQTTPHLGGAALPRDLRPVVYNFLTRHLREPRNP